MRANDLMHCKVLGVTGDEDKSVVDKTSSIPGAFHYCARAFLLHLFHASLRMHHLRHCARTYALSCHDAEHCIDLSAHTLLVVSKHSPNTLCRRFSTLQHIWAHVLVDRASSALVSRLRGFGAVIECLNHTFDLLIGTTRDECMFKRAITKAFVPSSCWSCKRVY